MGLEDRRDLPRPRPLKRAAAPCVRVQTETEPGAQSAPWPLSLGLPALLDEHVLQPDAERVQVLPEPVSHNVGFIEFVACLLTGRK